MACPAQVPTSWLCSERHPAGASQQLQASFLSSLQPAPCSLGGAPLLIVAGHSKRCCSATQQQQQQQHDNQGPRASLPPSLPWVAPFASITGAFFASMTGGDWAAGRPGARQRDRGGEERPLRAGRPDRDLDAGGRTAASLPRQAPQGEVAGQEAAESQSEDDSQDSEVLMPRGARLNKRDVRVFCSTCHHNTLFDEPDDLIECSCCHRVFHLACYERHVSRTENIALPYVRDAEEGVPWFHSQACRKVDDHIRKETAAGERRINTTTSGAAASSRGGGGMFSWLPWQSGGGGQQQGAAAAPAQDSQGFHTLQALEAPEASWRLMHCGAQSSPASRIAMSQVYTLLARDFGYTLGDYSSFDLAALLRRHGKPVCAAIVDIYGPDVAEVFVMATRKDVRRQGNCRLLMQQLAGCLQAAGIRRMVVSIDDDDDNARAVWDRLGFQPLEETVRRQLSWSLPAFSSDATEGTLYLGQELKPRKGLLA